MGQTFAKIILDGSGKTPEDARTMNVESLKLRPLADIPNQLGFRCTIRVKSGRNWRFVQVRVVRDSSLDHCPHRLVFDSGEDEGQLIVHTIPWATIEGWYDDQENT